MALGEGNYRVEMSIFSSMPLMAEKRFAWNLPNLFIPPLPRSDRRLAGVSPGSVEEWVPDGPSQVSAMCVCSVTVLKPSFVVFPLIEEMNKALPHTWECVGQVVLFFLSDSIAIDWVARQASTGDSTWRSPIRLCTIPHFAVLSEIMSGLCSALFHWIGSLQSVSFITRREVLSPPAGRWDCTQARWGTLSAIKDSTHVEEIKREWKHGKEVWFIATQRKKCSMHLVLITSEHPPLLFPQSSLNESHEGLQLNGTVWIQIIWFNKERMMNVMHQEMRMKSLKKRSHCSLLLSPPLLSSGN
jgi:hypothetical protein